MTNKTTLVYSFCGIGITESGKRHAGPCPTKNMVIVPLKGIYELKSIDQEDVKALELKMAPTVKQNVLALQSSD